MEIQDMCRGRAIHNHQHFHKCTKSTLFIIPRKVYGQKCWFLKNLVDSQINLLGLWSWKIDELCIFH
jgi:hypothetical protein